MPRADWALAGALAAATLAAQWPSRTRILPTWDAVQFALALREYDIVRHQPHPPGYVLYVAAGRALAWLAGDPAAALTALGVLGSAVAVLLVYRLGWSLEGRPVAVVAALGCLTSPLLWADAAAGLPYAVEAALATAVALAAWAMRRGGRRALVAAALLLGVAGGVRQSVLLLMGPLWLGMAWLGFRRPGPVLAGAALVGLATAAWAGPMLSLVGPRRYVAASLDLYASTVHATTVVGGGWGRNLVGLTEALLVGFGVFLPVLAYALRRARRDLDAPRAMFFALWIVPPLAVYGFVHLGQPGYLLTVLPAGYLLIARTLVGWGTRRDAAARPARFRPGAVGAIAAALVLHAAFFLAAPPVDVPFPDGTAPFRVRAEAALRAWYRFRLWPHTEAALRERQAVVMTYVDAVRREFPPWSTVLVTELGNPRSYPWFRHAMYYLPEYAVYHLRLGAAGPGYLLSRELTTMAAIDDRRVPLPVGTRRLVWLVEHWDPARPAPPGLVPRPLPYGRWLYVLPLERGGLDYAGYRLERVTALSRLR